MQKLSYKLPYWQACVLRDYVFEVSSKIKPQAAYMLAAVLAVSYGLKLSRKLLLSYPNKKTISIPYSDALAIYILSANKKIGDLNDKELAIILPMLRDVDSKIISAPKPATP